MTTTTDSESIYRTRPDATYVSCTRDAIPADVRWITPRQHQGQTIEVSYAHWKPSWADEPNHGDAYRRVTDHSLGPKAHRFSRRADVAPCEWVCLSKSGLGLEHFDRRESAESVGESRHGHDGVFQFVPGRRAGANYVDATGRRLGADEVLAALKETSARVRKPTADVET